MLFNKLWSKPGSIASWDQYQGVLKQLKVFKDIKNFYIYNTFFRHVVDVHVVALIIETTNCMDIDKF